MIRLIRACDLKFPPRLPLTLFMTAHDSSIARGGWRRWLGLGGDRSAFLASDEEGAPAGPETLCGSDPAGRRRRRILDAVSEFLLQNQLPVTAFTLEAAHDIVTGANPVLCAAVAEHVAQGKPLTLHWLEDIHEAMEADQGAAQLHALILRLETTIDEFASAATAARTATSDYNSALEAHMGGLETIDRDGDVIQQLTALAHDMLDRTREVARELTRSERETRVLQRRLADARAEAEIDHLTGLPNRRAFESRYDQEYAATRTNGEPLCVAFCDIDEFKRINDLHGHEAGDRVLRTVARSLAAMSGDMCHVARHGGEEFVILLRDKPLDEAFALIDEARETIASRRLINRVTDVPFGRITLSAGVANVHAYSTAREALRAADDALLRAKDGGRNLVLKANPSD